MHLETERLVLREMMPNDCDVQYKVLTDSDTMQYYPYTFEEDRAQDWDNRNIERYQIFGFGL